MREAPTRIASAASLAASLAAPALAALVLAAVFAVALAATPLRAQTAESEPGAEADKPLSEEIEDVIRGLVETVEPALKQLRDTFEVFERIDSLEHYEEPEILPNGDIIMRRKEDAPPYEPDSAPGSPPDDVPAEEPGIRT